jgi:hypothetical protein
LEEAMRGRILIDALGRRDGRSMYVYLTDHDSPDIVDEKYLGPEHEVGVFFGKNGAVLGVEIMMFEEEL